MSFSPTDACFEGFRVTRSRPGAIVLWAAIWLVGLIVAGLVTMPFLSPHLDEIQQTQGNANALSAGAQQALNMAGFAATPVIVVLQAVLMPAVYRAVMRPDQTSFGSLRLGADEARVLVVLLGLNLVSVAVQLAGEALQGVVAAQAGVIAALAVGSLFFAFSIWFSVRSALMAPATFAERRISLGAPFAMTGHHFWPLLGMLIISIVMALLVILLLLVVGWPLYAIALQAAAAPTALAAVAAIGLVLLMPLAATLTCVIIWAPFAAAYRDLKAS